MTNAQFNKMVIYRDELDNLKRGMESVAHMVINREFPEVDSDTAFGLAMDLVCRLAQ